MVVEWSTENIAPMRRFEEWREACCQQVYALTPERQERAPFNGRLRHYRAGPLDVVDVRCDGHLVQRRLEDIRRQPSTTCYVYRQLEGSAWFEQRGRQLIAHAGDIVIADPNVAFATGAEGSFDFRLWRLERSRIEPMLALRNGDLPMIRLERHSPEGALINSWLDGLLRTYAGMQPHSIDLAVGTLCTLVADAAGLSPEMRGRGRDSRRAAQLQRVLRWLELHCTDPDLNAEKAATGFAMSLRALHQLFEPSGSTFHEQLTEARLRKAHALLSDAVHAQLSTAEIGFAAGFRETSTFYRRFRQRFGVTPGELREQS